MRCSWVLVVGGLLGLSGVVHAADIDNGKLIFGQRCAFCHGPGGQGDGPAGAALQPVPTNFTKPDFWTSPAATKLRDSIKNGKPGTAMVGFGPSLSAVELDNLTAFVQSLAPK